ncbi:siderophore-interacting protein [Streptomyces tsukubensis]|uniref:NADPH-dependent ferric siderophore reductase n=1 Tax=Streptomyces tsukubensis TaxID=83656 RepID=A0A1V4AFU1_9ACTN|nr:siderophore-interacting protein [Streptomyces tsukubensis]OON82239.1 NADPH-dependent ferric siderophore reductase [Streptomyces tsukubensis]QFR92730.1 siderophore-interacting protein [Streptomyces tsukubensis]
MAERPARPAPKAHTAQVVRTERLTPHMQRVVLGGEGLAEFSAADFTDHYIKLLFPPDGGTFPEPFDIAAIRAEQPRERWPVTRTYTVRDWDPDIREFAVDFVIHGDEGIAGPWAAAAKPGDTLRFLGPGGAYKPLPETGVHLLAGDESALPAVAAAVERMPAGAVFHAFVEVSDASEEQKVGSPEGGTITWLHRGTRPVGEALIEAVRGVDFPAAEVQAFVHGEAGFVKELRRYLRIEREVERERLSISGYWRLGHNEDGWQASKREWNAQVEAEQESAR